MVRALLEPVGPWARYASTVTGIRQGQQAPEADARYLPMRGALQDPEAPKGGPVSALVVWCLSWALLGAVLAVTTHVEAHSRRVGGITFVRVGQWQFSYCKTRKPMTGGKAWR